MIRIIALFVLMSLCVVASAQSYRTSAGLRFTTARSLGVSVQQKVFEKTTLEGILLSNTLTNNIDAMLLLEQHQKILFKNFNIYFGAGIHKTWYGEGVEETAAGAPSGAAAVVGIEASLGRLNVSWDVLPKANVWGGDRFFDLNSGFSIRYILVKKKKKEINWKFWKKDDKKKNKKKEKTEKEKFNWKFWKKE